MEKTAFLIAILSGVIFANVCCTVSPQPLVKTETESHKVVPSSTYGAYLAGRVAHIRHDLNTSADYYMFAAEKAPQKQMLSSQLYIMLTSQGRVDEAVKYADEALKNNDKSPFIKTIKAVHSAKLGQYDEALQDIKSCNNDFSREIFNPLMNAWIYAGKKDYEKALNSLEPLHKNKAFAAMYLFHAGAISDYLGKNEEADKYYTLLMGIKGMELSVFPTRVISNFYLRTNNPQKIKQALSVAGNENNLVMKNLSEKLTKLDSSVVPVLSDASVGMSDSLFGIALILQQENATEEISLLFASLANYANPKNDLPKILMGSILESKELNKEANEIYAQITPEQDSYYSALFQIARNNTKMEKYKEAETILRQLLQSYQPNPDIYIGLGEIMRMTKRYKDAIIYYNKALDFYPKEKQYKVWSTVFVLGMSYAANEQNDKAEEAFRKVLTMNPNPVIKNHLGYTLLQNNENIEEAFTLIVDAYLQSSDEGTIVDSLGWAFYNIGQYELAIKYLEKASDLAPSEAIIYDHLGDAYWESGRYDEAVFQWNHAVSLKDNSGEIDKNAILQKIENGKTPHIPYSYDEKMIDNIIKKIKSDN